ncbi:MAG: SDR family oxidoreductase [Lachnospiraceae bacterium]|nr:SDR family oxidoreductase [Lachnospiraceae bacterium]
MENNNIKESCVKAIVTGASSGIGLEITRLLLENNYIVYGFGKSFNKGDSSSKIINDLEEKFGERFIKIECDLRDTSDLVKAVKDINKNHDISVLINNAGVGYYGLHEELNSEKIMEMVRVNLEVPMLLTNLLLRDLKNNEGHVINISSITATKDNPHGCAYGATKAGLLSFSKSLFEENRKYGLRVTCISPDMTDTNLYRNADFTADGELMAHLEPVEVAKACLYALNGRKGMVLTDITLRPQLHRISKKK